MTKATCKLLKACKLSWKNKVTVKTLILAANLLQALPRRLCCCGSHFRFFRQRILFRIQEAIHISNLWLELVIILLPAALLKWFDCNSCAVYGASKHDKSCLLLSFSFYILRISMWKISKRRWGQRRGQRKARRRRRIGLERFLRRSDKTEKNSECQS